MFFGWLERSKPEALKREEFLALQALFLLPKLYTNSTQNSKQLAGLVPGAGVFRLGDGRPPDPTSL